LFSVNLRTISLYQSVTWCSQRVGNPPRFLTRRSIAAAGADAYVFA
jgi:hypothetical protein